MPEQQEQAKSFTIDNVYPWGRSFDEYRLMFDLSEAELSPESRILSVADGPASFNAEFTRRGGGRVTSCDPLYRFDAGEIRSRVEQTYAVIVQLARRDAHRFCWTRFRSPDDLGRERLRAMETFLGDYEVGKRDGRYLDRSLPRLGFADDGFDLALCSHFLFLYSDEFTAEQHVEAIVEMARLAPDVRAFPLLDMRGEPSRHLLPVIESLRERGLRVVMRKVVYEFQRGGNQMLQVTRSRLIHGPTADRHSRAD